MFFATAHYDEMCPQVCLAKKAPATNPKVYSRISHIKLHAQVDYRAPRWRLATRCHGHIIGDKSNRDQDTSLRAEMGNPNLSSLLS